MVGVVQWRLHAFESDFCNCRYQSQINYNSFSFLMDTDADKIPSQPSLQLLTMNNYTLILTLHNLQFSIALQKSFVSLKNIELAVTV